MSLGPEKPPKQKLTLAIDKDIIEKAKTAGINISAITETVLESITFDVKSATRQDIVDSYERLFEVIKNVLKKYDAEMEVGVEQLTDGTGICVDVILKPTGLWASDSEGTRMHKVKLTDIVASEYNVCFSPFEILQNLLKALISASEQNREHLKELEIAMRFVRALSKDENQTE